MQNHRDGSRRWTSQARQRAIFESESALKQVLIQRSGTANCFGDQRSRPAPGLILGRNLRNVVDNHDFAVTLL